ncbi:MAG: hypothetical protein ACRENP_01070 [Longimicrobiales bacterium]
MPSRSTITRPAVWVLAGGAAILLAGSCARNGGNRDRPERLEPALLRVIEVHPDSVVGVLIRLHRDVVPEDREQLARLGLSLGSAAGRVVTGNIRAGHARRITRWPNVEWVELSGQIRLSNSKNNVETESDGPA